MQRWYPTDIRCRLFPLKELPDKYHAGFNQVLEAQEKKDKPIGEDKFIRVGEIVFFPFKEWFLYPILILLMNGLFLPIFFTGILLASTSESGANTLALNILLAVFLISLYFFQKHIRIYLKMRKRRSRQPFGMYLFPDAVILRYSPRFVYRDFRFGSCRYFPKEGISEVIIDENLIGGYDEPVARKYWPQFYFKYLSEEKKSLYTFYDFPFDSGGRVAFEELVAWLQRRAPKLPKLNSGRRI